MTWVLSAVTATVENSQNEYNKDMCIKNAIFRFEEFNIIGISLGGYEILKSDHTIVESVQSKYVNLHQFDDIVQRIANNCHNYIYSMEELPDIDETKHVVCFDVDYYDDLGNFYITFSYTRAVAEWDAYNGEAWYEIKRNKN